MPNNACLQALLRCLAHSLAQPCTILSNSSILQNTQQPKDNTLQKDDMQPT